MRPMGGVQGGLAAAVCAALLACTAPAAAQQVADTTFRPAVSAPAFPRGAGPVVLIDDAHHNFHTSTGRFLPFVQLLQRDGFDVRPATGAFTRDVLRPAAVLVIANALNERNVEDWMLPTPSAFTREEIEVVREWVRDGGALLLIADHMPFPGAAAALAEAFGVLFHNGFASDSTGDGQLAFRRDNGSLAGHPVTDGRTTQERVDSVIVFTGQGFRLAGRGTPLMTLPAGAFMLVPEEAWVFSEKRTPRIPAAGLLQGALIRFGRGRVAVFGEAAMFSAQLGGPQRNPMGMNSPRAAQNAQFVLNVLHWLTGLLPDA